MQCISQSFTVVSLFGSISKDSMNEGSFNKQATFLQTDPQLRSISTIHILVLMYMHSSETKLLVSLLHCEDMLS